MQTAFFFQGKDPWECLRVLRLCVCVCTNKNHSMIWVKEAFSGGKLLFTLMPQQNIVSAIKITKVENFPVVMYGCESWTVKKAERRRIDAFELWCWRRLLRVPWTERRSNQSILKEINPGCSLEGMMLKLKLQYFGHLMRRVDSLEKTLMLGGIGAGEEGDYRGWDGWMASPTQWTWVWVNSGSWWWTRRPAAAAAKSLQSCPTLCDPTDGSPPGSPIPGILQARTLEWGANPFSSAWKWKVKSESEVAQ